MLTLEFITYARFGKLPKECLLRGKSITDEEKEREMNTGHMTICKVCEHRWDDVSLFMGYAKKCLHLPKQYETSHMISPGGFR